MVFASTNRFVSVVFSLFFNLCDAGGSQVRFSIGAGDRQAYQPPLHSSLPVTTSCAALFFQKLGKIPSYSSFACISSLLVSRDDFSGISNGINLFCAALTDHKILFHSQSYTQLVQASHAVTSLLYPLKYRLLNFCNQLNSFTANNKKTSSYFL